jgi:hypothetical protein
MKQTQDPGASAPASKLDRLFNRDKFRRRTMKFYRVAGPMVLAFFAVSLLQTLGLVGEMSEQTLPGWLLTLYALLTFGIALASPVLFVLATVGGMALKSDWRFAAPLWLFSGAAGLFLVTVFFVRDLPLPDQQQAWTIASALLLASAAWATAVGYRR